jgi:hypothetical protein
MIRSDIKRITNKNSLLKNVSRSEPKLVFERLFRFMDKHKYNLTIGQRLLLPIIWLVWIGRPIEVRKTWHNVKKGMEKHMHNFVIPEMYKGYLFMNCDHEGCNMCKPVD